MKISLCLIVKNEGQTLAACLASSADLVAETIVVDTGSNDQTREVAIAHGTKVFDLPWCDDFAAARNEGLRHAGGNWILWLDADEYFDEVNRQKLRKLFVNLKDDNAAYIMIQRSHQQTVNLGSRVQQVRLFRKHPAVRWEYRVHEQLLACQAGLGHCGNDADLLLNLGMMLLETGNLVEAEKALVRMLEIDVGRIGNPCEEGRIGNPSYGGQEGRLITARHNLYVLLGRRPAAG